MSKRTKLGRWAEVWGRMDDQGMPTNSAGVEDWRGRYDSPHAAELEASLDALQGNHLSMAVVELVGNAVIAAFKMGKEFDGRCHRR